MYIIAAFVILMIIFSLWVIFFSKRDWRPRKKDGIGEALFYIFIWGFAIFVLAAILKALFG